MIVDRDVVHGMLTRRLSALNDRVGHIEADMAQPLDDDCEEQVVDRSGFEALDAVESAALCDIAKTQAALQRLELGTYGICTVCGDEIAAQRLAALPTAAQCIACARSAVHA